VANIPREVHKVTKQRIAAIAVAAIIGATGLIACADDVGDPGPLVLSKMGLMYVGGRQIQMQSAGGRLNTGTQTQIVEQAPVHYLIPPEDRRRGKTPVIMVAGMGLSSYLYLGTPDGRAGWAQVFAAAGHPVYVFDEPNNAVSGFDVSPFNAVRQGRAEASTLPGFMLWSNETPWRRWGIGPEPGVPFEDTRYPVEHIGQLYASMTPVYQVGRGRSGARAKAVALVALLDLVGPAALVVHSASGGTGFEATRLRPDLVTAIVAVEVTGSPSDPGDIERAFADKRFIGLFGDHFDVRRMAGRYQACVTTAELINEQGGQAEVFWLPEMGIRGNTHLMMQDNNSHDIAAMVLQRLAGTNAPAPPP